MRVGGAGQQRQQQGRIVSRPSSKAAWQQQASFVPKNTSAQPAAWHPPDRLATRLKGRELLSLPPTVSSVDTRRGLSDERARGVSGDGGAEGSWALLVCQQSSFCCIVALRCSVKRRDQTFSFDHL